MKIGFASFHPVSAFLFYVLAFALSLTAAHPITLLSVFVTGIIYDVKLRGKKSISFLLKFILPLTLLTTLINGLFNHYGVTVLFTMPNGNLFTLEALVYGFVFALRADCMLIWLNSFNEIITSDKIIYLFGRLSPKTALLISMVLRFIPLISSQSSEIARSEKGVGGAAASKSFIGKIRSAAKRFSILVSWSLERGIDTQYAMTARGYGLKHRSSYGNYIFGIKDGVLVSLCVCAAAAYFLTSKSFSAIYNPIISIPTPDILQTLISIFIAVCLLLPTVIDASEERKWSISK